MLQTLPYRQGLVLGRLRVSQGQPDLVLDLDEVRGAETSHQIVAQGEASDVIAG